MIQSIDLCLIITPPSVWEQSIAMSVSVCLCACRSVYLRAYRAYIRKYISNLDQFCECYLWPWLSPPLAALRYVVCFRFYGCVIFAHNGRIVDRLTVAACDVMALSCA